jgi:hypothetical protein
LETPLAQVFLSLYSLAYNAFLPSDFDIITPPKPVSKTYVVVVATLVNEQVENIKKVYSEKMAKLDKDLSQEAKRHESEEK